MPLRISPDSSPLPGGPLVFLAGSIEQGTAAQWQPIVAERLLDVFPDVVVANPRREQWDVSWPQTKDHPAFVEQVNWELDHLLGVTEALFVFDPATQSPVTLLELGLLLGLHPERVTLVCPARFWRHGNVLITAERFGVEVFEDMESGIGQVLDRLRQRLIQ